MSKVFHVSGYLLSNARKNCRFYFGDFFISCNLDERNRCFMIQIHKELRSRDGKVFKIEEYLDIEHFKKFWGPQWKIFFANHEEA